MKICELFFTGLWSSEGGACKVSFFELVYKFINKFYKIWILRILYNALLRKWWCGQVLWVDLFITIHIKFILYCLSLLQISTGFGTLYEFL
jgi:hypothetical protein